MSIEKIKEATARLEATQIIISQGIDEIQQSQLDLQKKIDEMTNIDPELSSIADRINLAVNSMKTALDEKPV